MNKISDKHLTFLICLAISLSIFIVFGQVRHHQFINFDDDWYIYDNSHINTGISKDNIIWTFTNDHAGNFHPLTSISHMLDCNLFDLNAGGHHFINLLFHLANSLLLFLVLKNMTSNIWASAFVAALFALHPGHVESVAWASERKDVLSTFFAFLTLASYVHYIKKQNFYFYVLSVFLFTLGLLSKPMLVTLPVLMLLLDYWPLERAALTRSSVPAWRKLIIEKIPFLELAVIMSVYTFYIQKNVGFVQDLSLYSFAGRIENALMAYMTYIYKLFVPTNLAIFYPFPPDGWKFSQYGTAFILLACITILSLWQIRKRPWFAAGWFWFVISLIPVIGLIQVGLQTWADRYTYLSYIGLFWIITWGVPQLFSGFPYKKVVLAFIAVALLSILSVLTWFQVGCWHDNVTLYEHAIKVVPGNWWAYRNLGQEYVQQGKLDKAVEQFTIAHQIFPGNGDIGIDLGETLVKLGKYNEAIEVYQGFLEPLPEDFEIDPEALKQRKFNNAMSFFAKAHLNFAKALLIKGKYDQSVLHFISALKLKPSLVPDVKNSADSLLNQNHLEDAFKLYTHVLPLMPSNTDVLNKLARLASIYKDAPFYNPAIAINLAKSACELSNYQTPEFIDTLAISYAAAGDFQNAVESAQKALNLAQSAKNEPLAAQIQSRLNLYKSGQQYIETMPKTPAR